jgi:hypothetical protein
MEKVAVGIALSLKASEVAITVVTTTIATTTSYAVAML